MPLERIQVLVSPEERELFRRAAAEAGASLSAWVRDAARERLEAGAGDDALRTPEGLRAFFAGLDRRRAGEGPEPDWEEHRRTIDHGKRSGAQDG